MSASLFDLGFLEAAEALAQKRVSSAELTAEEKDSISHRGNAVRGFVAYLKQLAREGAA